MRSVEEDVGSEAAGRVGLPHPSAWLAATLGILAVGGFLYVGRLPLTGIADRRFQDTWVRGIVTEQTVLVVVAVLIVGFLCCARRFFFARAVRKPGAIEVLPFVDGTEEKRTFEAAAATFRKTLAGLSLAAPTPLPGSAPPQSFLKSVSDSTKEARSPVAIIAGVLGALWVDCGYRVSVTARTAAAGSSCGLDVSVLSLPGGPGETRTVWADTWCNAARQAADIVGAFVLARTALCTQGPWPHWRGHRINPRLFGFYQRAQGCLREQRYEEALSFCFQALDLDPLNAPIRILACQVQEKLGLYLSAATGYADVIATESSEVDHRLRRRLDREFTSFSAAPLPRKHRRTQRSGARRNRESLLIARYRFVCALANTDNALDRRPEFFATDDNAIRREELVRLKQRVKRWSDTYLQRLEVGPIEEKALFPLIAWCEAADLVRDYAWWRGRRGLGMPVSQAALRLLRVWTLAHLDHVNLPPVGNLDECRRRLRWPSDASPRTIVDVVRHQLGRAPERWRTFQDYYNAAAVLGVRLQDRQRHPDPAERAERTAVERTAVGYLERAVESAPRAMVWQYSRWFAAEDQSLSVLRGSPYYVDFLERHFPGTDRREERPENVLHYLFSTHVLVMAANYARLRARTVRRLQAVDGPTIQRAELRAAQAMRDYSADYGDWRTRLALIEVSRDSSDDAVAETFERSFPRFQDEPASKVAPSRATTDCYYNHLIDRRLCPGIWPDVHGELARIVTQLEHPTENVVVDTSPMWETLAEFIDAALRDREPHPEDEPSSTMVERSDRFHRAARAAVRPSPPPGRAPVQVHRRARAGEAVATRTIGVSSRH